VSVAPRAAPSRASIDGAIAAIVARAHPSLADVVSLWPRARRADLVVAIRVDEAGRPSLRAWLRAHDFDVGDADVARAIRAIRGDVPVVIDLGDRVAVLPLAAFPKRKEAKARIADPRSFDSRR
jgi:hypothetical protein